MALKKLKPKNLKSFVIDTLWIARKKKTRTMCNHLLERKTLKIDACFIIAQDPLYIPQFNHNHDKQKAYNT
jgi:hypothetical protein